MTSELWGRVCQAFDHSMAMEQGQRSEFLSDLRASDPEAALALEGMLRRQAAPPALQDLPTNLVDHFLETEAPGTADSAHVDSLPEQIGPYRVIRQLARGGMGVVMLATDERFQRPVAVKVLASEHARVDELVQRFQEEAQLMGRLQHPGIPPVHDRGTLADGRPYMVMKLIKGQTLAELMSRTKPAPESGQAADTHWPSSTLSRLLNVFEQICHTVAYAHAREVIHRDLKPGNIMVGAHGEVQVMDWGLAKFLVTGKNAVNHAQVEERTDQAKQEPYSVMAPAVKGPSTVVGSIMGTLAYMAPEQARGQVDSLDERCDVFGLGAVLCEILTGYPPYTAANAKDLKRQAQDGDVNQAHARLDACEADGQLVALVKECLAFREADRPKDGGAVAARVAGYHAEVRQRLKNAEVQQAAARVKGEEERKRRAVNRRWAAIVGLFLVLACAAGVWSYVERDQIKQNARKNSLKAGFDTALKKEEQLAKDLHSRLADYKDAQALINNPDLGNSWLEQRGALLEQAKIILTSAPDLADPQDLLKNRQSRLEGDKEQLSLIRELDDIHQESFLLIEKKNSTNGYQWDPTVAGPKYARFFAKHFKVDVAKGDLSEMAAVVKKLPLRHVLVAALDHWAEISDYPGSAHRRLLPRLLQWARKADANEWRDRFRLADVWDDPHRLELLAAEFHPEDHSPQIISALGNQLARHNHNGTSRFGAGLVQYPDSFWLIMTLANWLPSSFEKAGYYQAALVARPASGVAWSNLGMALRRQRKFSEAIDSYQKAAPFLFNGQAWTPHFHMGSMFLYLGRFDHAQSETNKAVDLVPKDNAYHSDVMQQCHECVRCAQVLAAEKGQRTENPGRDGIKGRTSPKDPRDLYFNSNKSPRRAHILSFEKNKTYVIDLESTDFDTILRIETLDGVPLLENDDFNKAPNTNSSNKTFNTNSRLVFSPDKDGLYKLVVSSFYAAKASLKYGDYVLKSVEAVTEGKPQEWKEELQFEPTKPEEGAKYRKEHEVSLTKGVAYVFELNSQRFDPYLQLCHSEDKNKALVFNDDIVPGNPAARIDFSPAETGKYTIVVTSFYTRQTGPYTLSVRGFKPKEAPEVQK